MLVHCGAFNQLIHERGTKKKHTSVAHFKGDVILLKQFGPGNQSTVSLGWHKAVIHFLFPGMATWHHWRHTIKFSSRRRLNKGSY